MTSIYGIIRDYYGSDQLAQRLKDEEKRLGHLALAKLPGCQIMATKPTSFAALFKAFTTYVHTGGYTWNGSAGGGIGSPLLDGEKSTGECLMFARALSILAYAPKPYGLALNRDDAPFTSYTGLNKKGFVSAHNTVLNLAANVNGQPLYLWENHKVLAYQGRYYDPSYNKIYDDLRDMALYHILDTVDFGGVDYHQAERRGDSQGYWFKEQPLGTYYGPAKGAPF